MPLTSCRPAPLYSIILVCMIRVCLVVTCDNIPTIGAGAQIPADLGLPQPPNSLERRQAARTG